MKGSIITLFFIVGLALSQTGFSQEFSVTDITVKRSGIVDPKTFGPDYQPQFIHLEKPVPGGGSYKGFLLEQKIKVREVYPPKDGTPPTGHRTQAAPTPQVIKEFGTFERYITGFVSDLMGGIPNDNALAINQKEQLVTGFNSSIWGWDLKADTFLFDEQHFSLTDFSTSGNTDHFDPKLIYDPGSDRFILVFIEDRSPSASQIVVCFSTTNDPRDPWNSYNLPGNPLNNNRWTDYPTISVTDDALYITGNLIISGVSWQIGFDGSIIWQIDKADGYAGETELTSKVFSDIRHNGRFIRNLHPVRGAYGIAESQFFLSNRNFDLTNDSIFILEMRSKIDEPGNLNIQVRKSDIPYGMPPNGRQFDTDLNDPTEGLLSNDARVLGAFLLDDHIQFVSTSVNPKTGYSAIYHGLIKNVFIDPVVKANIIGHPTMDLGYPNIAFSGNEPCDGEAIIGVSYTSPSDFAGVGAYFFSNDSLYSDLMRIRDGDNYINRLLGGLERWGDYSGIQRKYESPGTVLINGFYGMTNRGNGSWNTILRSPDTIQLVADFRFIQEPSACDGIAEVSISGGVEPYEIVWDNGTIGYNRDGICLGDSVSVTISDSRGCSSTFSRLFSIPEVNGGFPVYPNPTSNMFSVQFDLPHDKKVSARLYDSMGREVQMLQERWVPGGRNEFTFSLAPLSKGVYFIRLVADGKILEEARIIKN